MDIRGQMTPNSKTFILRAVKRGNIMKSSHFPEFDELSKLAKENPEALEKLRKDLVEQLIQSAPEQYQNRLKGLQVKIDMERRRAKTPIASCIRISQMMQESFTKLRDALNQMQNAQAPEKSTGLTPINGKGKSKVQEIKEPILAEVIEFPTN